MIYKKSYFTTTCPRCGAFLRFESETELYYFTNSVKVGFECPKCHQYVLVHRKLMKEHDASANK